MIGAEAESWEKNDKGVSARKDQKNVNGFLGFLFDGSVCDL